MRLSIGPADVPKSSYQLAVTHDTAIEIHDGKCVLLGYVIENNDAAAVYLQCYDNPAASVTEGSDIVWAKRAPAGADAEAGRDPVNHPLHYFANGLSITASAARNSSSAVGTDPTITIYYMPLP